MLNWLRKKNNKNADNETRSDNTTQEPSISLQVSQNTSELISQEPPPKVQQTTNRDKHVISKQSKNLEAYNGEVANLIEPYQPTNITFPKTKFRDQNRSFDANWFIRFPWLHYDVNTDSAFCFTCVKALKNRVISSDNVEPTFVRTGYRDWKKACEKGRGFSKHQKCGFHNQAIDRMPVPATKSIGNLLSENAVLQQEESRRCLLKIFRNIKFLARQGIPMRGDWISDKASEFNSNFHQLNLMIASSDHEFRNWLDRKQKKYTSPDMQNEMMEILSHAISRKIIADIREKSSIYTIMADETADVSNTEQLVICTRWVDSELEAHEEFIGLLPVPSTDADTIYTSLKIVLTSVTLAMEKKGAQRELISVLLSDLFGLKVLCELDIELGFQALMNALPELKLDTPDAAEVLGKFMARCVADDCLNPCYIKEHTHAEDLARACLNQALVYLEERHGLTRLDTIWGLGGGRRPVKTLIKSMVMLIKEYISSRDMREAERCLVELEVPHFHHELVYEALVIAIESGLQLTKDAVVELLKHFSNSMMITEDQMVCGFKRVFGGMDDLVLDVPLAHRHLDDLLEKCCRAHIIPLSLRHQAPSRGRKRFVSEGDFGMSTRPIF